MPRRGGRPHDVGRLWLADGHIAGAGDGPKPKFAALGTEVEIRVLGENRRVVVIEDRLYDPTNAALRA